MSLQAAAVTGHGNLVVQITGDANNVTLGATQLVLHRQHCVGRPAKRLLELLVTKVQAVPFVGREAELGALQGWLDGPDAVRVRCVTGGAGSGKTRLALELCALAEATGWDVGFAE